MSTKEKKKEKSKLRSFLDGSILIKENNIRLVPFFIFLFLIALVLILNGYWIERMAKEINGLKKEMKELNFEESTTTTQKVELSLQSEMAKKLDTFGIKESVVPPIKIKVKKRMSENK